MDVSAIGEGAVLGFLAPNPGTCKIKHVHVCTVPYRRKVPILKCKKTPESTTVHLLWSQQTTWVVWLLVESCTATCCCRQCLATRETAKMQVYNSNYSTQLNIAFKILLYCHSLLQAMSGNS